jgi:hypothetical protein
LIAAGLQPAECGVVERVSKFEASTGQRGVLGFVAATPASQLQKLRADQAQTVLKPGG